MEIVYEVRDVTDEEVYYPLGLFSDLEKAKVFCMEGDSPPYSEWTEPDDIGHVALQIVPRPLDKWPQNSKHIATIEWTATYDDDGEPVWACREDAA